MNKPLIRHCKNCRWNDFEERANWCDSDIWCKVKYKRINKNKQRKEALFCPHFKKKWQGPDFTI